MKTEKINMDTIDDVVEKLEGGLSCPGTILCRVHMDNKLAILEGCVPNSHRDHVFVWCLALGESCEPKRNYYANTIAGALRKAVKEEGE